MMPEVTTEMYIDGAWTDTVGAESISDRVRQSDGVRITRGQVDQQSGVSAQQSIFTLNNRDGLFSGRNPDSPLFGKIGRNTRIRQGVKADDGTWEPYMLLPHRNGYGGFTSDKASLDVTGDIDIRIDFAPDTWRGTNWTLMGKYSTSGDQRSWLLRLALDGTILFSWSTAGTFATLQTRQSTALPTGGGRLAIRVTLDVDNGAGGHTVNWYTAPDIDSAWTLLDTETTAGVTSIFAGTAELEVGSANGGGAAITDTDPLAGKVWAAQVYNGIAGTLVADFRPDEQTDLDATGWTDTCASPNGWTLGTTRSPRLASDRIRFCGEIASLPQRWDLTGRDVFVPAQAFGIMRRLSTNSSPVRSAIYRNYRNYPDIIGYWAMEDEAGADQAANAVTGPPGIIQLCTFGGATGLDGSAGAITLTGSGGTSRVQLRTRAVSTTPTVCNMLWYFKLSNLPATAATFLTVQGTGIIRRWEVRVGTTTFEFRGYGIDGTEHINRATTFGTGANPTQGWIGMQLKMTQSGSNLLFENSWHAVGSETFYTTDVGGYLLLTPTGSIGRFGTATFSTAADSAFNGAQVAHVINAVEDLDFVAIRFRDASKGYAGETAGARMARFCEEEGIFFELLGDADETEAVGPQPIGKPADILSGAAAVDSGILGEVRDKLGLRYVTRRQISQANLLEIPYSDSLLDATPEAVEDDRYLQNDVTVNRPSGSSGRYVVEDGSLSVQDPPAGAGRYERSLSLSAATDTQLDPLAQWNAHLGTWDEYRVPTLSFNLNRQQITAAIAYNLLGLDWGSSVAITGMPAFLPPDDLNLLIFGYTEQINRFTHGMVHNTVPFGPWRNWYLDNDGSGEPRLDAEDHSLDGAINSSTVSIPIKAPTTLRAPKFIDSTNYPAEFPAGGGPPVYINVGGEKIEVTACTVGSESGGYWRQTLTVVRSVNGVSKAHDDGSQLRLQEYSWGTL